MQHLRLQINKGTLASARIFISGGSESVFGLLAGNGGCYTMHTDSGVSEPEGSSGAVQALAVSLDNVVRPGKMPACDPVIVFQIHAIEAPWHLAGLASHGAFLLE